MNREELMKKVLEMDFVLYDTSLFLDTHPTCRLALDFFREAQQKYAEYAAEYEMTYGPLTAFETDTLEGWTWVQGPWPWEMEG